MFERFTDRARRVVVLAQEEARLLNHDYIGTEHLLLGLLHEGEGLAAQSLDSVGVSLEKIRLEVQKRLGAGPTPPQGFMPFSPRAKKVLEFALRQALGLDVNYIGTEHILLAVVKEGEGVAAQILMTEVKGGLEAVEQEVMARIATFKVQATHQARMRTGSVHIGQDAMLKRLDAIEARLSAIEALLREQRGDEAVS